MSGVKHSQLHSSSLLWICSQLVVVRLLNSRVKPNDHYQITFSKWISLKMVGSDVYSYLHFTRKRQWNSEGNNLVRFISTRSKPRTQTEHRMWWHCSTVRIWDQAFFKSFSCIPDHFRSDFNRLSAWKKKHQMKKSILCTFKGAFVFHCGLIKINWVHSKFITVDVFKDWKFTYTDKLTITRMPTSIVSHLH